MSIDHIIVTGVFVILGSVGLAMMQSALNVVWKASGLSLHRSARDNRIAKGQMANIKIEVSRSVN